MKSSCMTVAVFAAALGAPVCAQLAAKQLLRDPTQPPTTVSVGGSERLPAAGAIKPQHIVIVGSKRYLLWKGRRYQVGEVVEGARIERIAENEVWLRDAAVVHKLGLFTGIEKRSPTSGVSATTTTRTNVDGQKGTPK